MARNSSQLLIKETLTILQWNLSTNENDDFKLFNWYYCRSVFLVLLYLIFLDRLYLSYGFKDFYSHVLLLIKLNVYQRKPRIRITLTNELFITFKSFNIIGKSLYNLKSVFDDVHWLRTPTLERSRRKWYQRHILKPVEHLQCSFFFAKIAVNCFRTIAPLQMFD